jgi:predicted transposase YdaD
MFSVVHVLPFEALRLTIRATTFYAKILRSAHMRLVWIWEQTAIISLHTINQLVFITETDSVYRAVRNKCLYSLHLQSNPVITHQFMRHPIYNVRYSAVPINSSLLPKTLHSSIIKTLVYNDRKYSVPFMTLHGVQCMCFVWSQNKRRLFP